MTTHRLMRVGVGKFEYECETTEYSCSVCEKDPDFETDDVVNVCEKHLTKLILQDRLVGYCPRCFKKIVTAHIECIPKR